MLKCLKQMYFALISTMILSFIHSGFRPITREFVQPKAKFVASDGFVDEINKGEEEITFISNKSQVPTTLKYRAT
jgi:hypothetical protein